MEIDNYNDQILQILSTNGRISNLELAERIGLSPSACLRRVQELERTGIISGYRAVLDNSRLDRGLVAYTAVGLSDHSRDSQESFETAIKAASEISECHNITGSYEYLLRVEVKDIAAYKAFHSKVLGALPQVNSITTYMVIDSPKDQRG